MNLYSFIYFYWLDRTDREVSFEELKNFAEKRHVLYLETSARDNINIDNIFYELAKQCINESPTIYETNKLELNENNEVKEKHNCCLKI